MSNQQAGHGTTIAFLTSNWQANVNTESIKYGGASRAVIPTTHLATAAPASANVEGNATSIPGKIYTLAPITMEVQFDPGAGKLPPLQAAAESIRLTWPNGETATGSGYVSERGEITIESDTLVKCSITIQRTGGWTVA